MVHRGTLRDGNQPYVMPFHGGNRGSNPRGDANFLHLAINGLVGYPKGDSNCLPFAPLADASAAGNASSTCMNFKLP